MFEVILGVKDLFERLDVAIGSSYFRLISI